MDSRVVVGLLGHTLLPSFPALALDVMQLRCPLWSTRSRHLHKPDASLKGGCIIQYKQLKESIFNWWSPWCSLVSSVMEARNAELLQWDINYTSVHHHLSLQSKRSPKHLPLVYFWFPAGAARHHLFCLFRLYAQASVMFGTVTRLLCISVVCAILKLKLEAFVPFSCHSFSLAGL